MDTWMKLLLGKVLVACWSQSDGETYGLHDGLQYGTPPDWATFRRMPSARLFLLEAGDVLTMPAGTYHYVYTLQRKIVVAADFLDGSCWQRRLDAVNRDKEIDVGTGAHDRTTGNLEKLRKAYEEREQRCASRASSS